MFLNFSRIGQVQNDNCTSVKYTQQWRNSQVIEVKLIAHHLPSLVPFNSVTLPHTQQNIWQGMFKSLRDGNVLRAEAIEHHSFYFFIIKMCDNFSWVARPQIFIITLKINWQLTQIVNHRYTIMKKCWSPKSKPTSVSYNYVIGRSFSILARRWTFGSLKACLVFFSTNIFL